MDNFQVHAIRILPRDILTRYPELCEVLAHLTRSLGDLVSASASVPDLIVTINALVQNIVPTAAVRIVNDNYDDVVSGPASSATYLILDYTEEPSVH